MNVLRPGEELIARETDFRSGTSRSSSVNDAYDLYLARQRSGDYVLIGFMKVQFFFRDGNSNTLKWTVFEKNDFVTRWQQTIQTTWGGRVIKPLRNGKKVRVDFRFQTRIGGWMLDHWELTVRKVESFTVSSVMPGRGNAELDSRDLTPAPKRKNPQTGVIYRQRGAVHEFGHMLGLDDEYEPNNPHKNDYASVMNAGETIYPRHDAVYMGWLNETLAEKRIT
jgi:hypothetical protein